MAVSKRCVLSPWWPDRTTVSRARNGEVGLLEGWGLAKAVDEHHGRSDKAQKRPIIAIVDVPSQAYGRREEALGIHQALAGAADSYARARLAGHR
jgi:malonate decarboxylase gamma subunit